MIDYMTQNNSEEFRLEAIIHCHITEEEKKSLVAMIGADRMHRSMNAVANCYIAKGLNGEYKGLKGVDFVEREKRKILLVVYIPKKAKVALAKRKAETDGRVPVCEEVYRFIKMGIAAEKRNKQKAQNGCDKSDEETLKELEALKEIDEATLEKGLRELLKMLCPQCKGKLKSTASTLFNLHI